MKKSIIALAVAGAMTVPMVAQADATLFGSIRYDVTDTDDVDGVDSNMNRVRIGVKGEETMDNGLTAGYFIRFQASGGDINNTNQNLAVSKTALYIAGDFGKVILGQADSPVQYIDGRQTYTAVDDGSLEFVGKELTSGGISYESNVYNGFQFFAGVGDIDADDADNGTQNDNEREMGFAVQYDNDVFGVTAGFGTTSNGVGRTDATDSSDADIYGISGEFKFANAKLGASYSEQDDLGKYYSVSGKYTMDKLTLAAQYEVKDLDAATDDQEAVNVSAKYALGGNAAVAVSYIDYNDEAEANSKDDRLTLRYSLSF